VKTYGFGLFLGLVLSFSLSSPSTPSPASRFVPVLGSAWFSASMSLAGDNWAPSSFTVGLGFASDFTGVEVVGSSWATIVDCDNGDAFGWLALRIVCSCGQRERRPPESDNRTILLGFADLFGRAGVGGEVVGVIGGVETFDSELARRRVVAVF